MRMRIVPIVISSRRLTDPVRTNLVVSNLIHVRTSRGEDLHNVLQTVAILLLAFGADGIRETAGHTSKLLP